MRKLPRKTWHEFLTENGATGPVAVAIDDFVDVNDTANPDEIDRAVVSKTDTDAGVNYTSAVAIDFGGFDKWRVLAYFRQAMNGDDTNVRIAPPAEGATYPVLMLPEGMTEDQLPVKPADGQ